MKQRIQPQNAVQFRQQPMRKANGVITAMKQSFGISEFLVIRFF